jgi:hypothetical protein
MLDVYALRMLFQVYLFFYYFGDRVHISLVQRPHEDVFTDEVFCVVSSPVEFPSFELFSLSFEELSMGHGLIDTLFLVSLLNPLQLVPNTVGIIAYGK